MKSNSWTKAAPKRVALVGNPNAGKTTLFNSLTGSRQKIANYPGVTVEQVSAVIEIDGADTEFVDVPGLYSLDAVSEDEAVAVSVIHDKTIDLIVCVIDGSNLERNLFIYTQICALGKPMMVALTMADRVEDKGQKVDVAKLSKYLGVPVVPIVGHKEKGLATLKAAVAEQLKNPTVAGPVVDRTDSILPLKDRLTRMGYDISTEELKEKILAGEPAFEHYFDEFPELRPDFLLAKEGLERILDPSARYAWTAKVQKDVVSTIKKPKKAVTLTDKIDLILTHRVFGLMIFVGIMYLVFQSIYTFATPLMDLITNGFAALGDKLGASLEGVPILKSLVVDGIVAGIGSVMVFLPQILILFFFIAMLEGTGYLARAAFLMDRLLGWCGLNGRAFIPLLSSFACAIPGIMAARVMPDAKSRLATILVAPLMSCSARLPVYMLMIGAFIEPKFGPFWAGFTLFAMHMLGFLLAIPVVYFLNRKMLKGKRLAFLLELPPYQMPKWKDVFIAMVTRGKVFVSTAGTTILVMSVIIWAAGYFPRYNVPAGTPEAQAAEIQLEHSVLGRFGKGIEPVFKPVGFDWRISTAILSAFPARETVVPSLGILFSLGKDNGDSHFDQSLSGKMTEAKWPDGKPLFTPWTAVGLMVFFALCAQCLSTLATVKRETNSSKWAWFMFAYMTAFAYIGALIVHLLAKLFGGA
ncbi:MAG: ferrous iron transport protein B [Armatimonadetes bacterium]|nr:ferrous iron transport protein B [Armatimonadota bacterium]